MPPKKEVKEKPVKGDEAEEMVLQYLKSVNRPYASTDVSANLKGKVPKALAQKIMQTLSEKGSLTLKPYGKQTIFVYNQSLLSVLSPEEMKSLDEELKEVQAEVTEKKKELGAIEKALSAKESEPRTKELPKAIEEARSDNEATTRALAPFRASGPEAVKPMTEAEIKAIDDEFAKWRKIWTDRRKVYKTLLDLVADGDQIADPRTFEEDQGISADDDEAREIDMGEFSRPVAIRRPPPKAKPAGVPAAAAPPKAKAPAVAKAPTKRQPSDVLESAPSQEEAPKKKKAKKAKE